MTRRHVATSQVPQLPWMSIGKSSKKGFFLQLPLKHSHKNIRWGQSLSQCWPEHCTKHQGTAHCTKWKPAPEVLILVFKHLNKKTNGPICQRIFIYKGTFLDIDMDGYGNMIWNKPFTLNMNHLVAVLFQRTCNDHFFGLFLTLTLLITSMSLSVQPAAWPSASQLSRCLCSQLNCNGERQCCW